MLDILKDKIINWSPEKADAYHNNLTRCKDEGKYIWENTSDGMFVTRDNSAHFIGFNGIVYRLTKRYNLNDWKMHELLYDECVKNNIRCDIPIESKLIDFNNATLQYSIVQRPNHQLGNDYFKDILDGKISTEYFIKYINQVHEVLYCVRNIKQFNNDNCPGNRFTVYHRAEDSIGHFWYDIKNWFMPYEQFLQENFKDFNNMLHYLKHNNVIVDIDLLSSTANKLWITDLSN